MKHFIRHRTTRRTAAVMLAVWLMALGTGFANACLVQEDHALHGHLGHPEADSTALPQAPMRDKLAGKHDATSGHLEAADQDGTASDKQACQNFCAAGQSGLLKQADPASAHPDTVLMSAAMWRLMPASAGLTVHLAAPDVPGWHGPPIFIRFLRLTI